MKVIRLKLNSPSEWQFLMDLLRRLHISFEWQEEKVMPVQNGLPLEDTVAALFGSWPSDKSSDELVSNIMDARVNQSREINL